MLGLLAGRKSCGLAQGAVRLDGAMADAAARRARIGYVTQEDVLPATSTVEEHLLFHAAVRAPHLGSDARRALVAHVLAALQLSAKARCAIGDGLVRGLSGGERRRAPYPHHNPNPSPSPSPNPDFSPSPNPNPDPNPNPNPKPNPNPNPTLALALPLNPKPSTSP